MNSSQPSSGGDAASYGRRLLLTMIRADGIQPYLYIDVYVGIRTCMTIYIGLVALLDSTIKLLYLYFQ